MGWVQGKVKDSNRIVNHKMYEIEVECVFVMAIHKQNKLLTRHISSA